MIEPSKSPSNVSPKRQIAQRVPLSGADKSFKLKTPGVQYDRS